MFCPVCGHDHVRSYSDVFSGKPLFSPCSSCIGIIRDKSGPPGDPPPRLCSCGRAFIDDVFVGLYHILVAEGLFSGEEPLSAVGVPLIDPGIFLRTAPFLPSRSLLLISSAFDIHSARKAFDAIPQVSGILLGTPMVPGVGDLADSSAPAGTEYQVLCGCDVRGDIFPTAEGPVVVYKKQAAAHIEFPHGIDLKIKSVERAIRRYHPHLFVDACCGAGTLGMVGLKLGVSDALLNDPWYAAAFFSGFNLSVNKGALGLEECSCPRKFSALSSTPVRDEPCVVAEGYGPEHSVLVCQGRMERLAPKISDPSVLTVFDPFDKPRFMRNKSFLSSWMGSVGGEVFIP